MARDHGFCTIHRLAYNRRMDPTCPQCMLGHIAPKFPDGTDTQLEFDVLAQKPLDPSGKPVDPFTLQPVA